MPSLTLRRLARVEIQEAHNWYEDQRPGLGTEFLAEVRSILAAVEEMPLLYPVIRRDMRRALLRRFPYSIIYIVDPDATVVLACFHASRDPGRWHRRR